MTAILGSLKPGTRFRTDDGRTGTLLYRNECRVLVRVDGGVRDVEFVDGNGETRAFQGRYAKTTSWTPSLQVEPIGFTPLDEEKDMATATKSKKTTKAEKIARVRAAVAARKAAKSEAPKAPRESKPKAPRTKPEGKMSLIDAAAKILAEVCDPMNCQEMVAKAAEKGYWTSPGGKTPQATLYSAILMEIKKKGTDARFVKTERGKFGLAK